MIAAPIGGLAVHGKLIVVAVPNDLMPVNAFPIVFGERSILGSLTGKAIDNQETLDFSVLQNVRPMIETVHGRKHAGNPVDRHQTPVRQSR